MLLGPIPYDMGFNNSFLKPLIHLFVLGCSECLDSKYMLGHWNQDLRPVNKNTLTSQDIS